MRKCLYVLDHGSQNLWLGCVPTLEPSNQPPLIWATEILFGNKNLRTHKSFPVRKARESTLNASNLYRHHPLLGFYFRAVDGTRTRDIHLGKVVLYQLSYNRITRRTTFSYQETISRLIRNQFFAFAIPNLLFISLPLICWATRYGNN